MSSEAPPTFNVGIFIPSYWVASTTGFDKGYADTHYLKFPVAQGTEYMTDLVVSGTTTLGATSASSLSVSGKTTTANIDLVNSSSTLDMKSGSITNLNNVNLSTINGVAYPQTAGINSVLATGSNATNKTLRMYNTNDISIDGDNVTMSRTLIPQQNTAITYNGVNVNNSASQSSLLGGDLKLTDNTSAPTINYTELTTTDFNIVGSSTATKNTLTPTNSTITDVTYTSNMTSNSLEMYLTANGVNSVSSSKLTNLGLNFYDPTSISINTNLSSSGLTILGSGAIKNVLTNASSVISGSSSTANKTTMSQSGLAVIGTNANITNTMIGVSTILNSSSNKNTITSAGITQILNADATTNNSVLNNYGLTLTGALTTTTNTINATSNAIADATYTGTLTSSALNLFTNAVSTSRNAITNLGMTITGSTTSITNTLTSASSIITDGTRTLTSGIVSSVATFKALAGVSGANSTVITPNSIYTYVVDGASTAYSLITGSNIVVQGATNINATINSTNVLLADATNTRYCAISSGGHTATGNSVNTTEQYLYLGSTNPDTAAAATNAVLITPSKLLLTSNNTSTSFNRCIIDNSTVGGPYFQCSYSNRSYKIYPNKITFDSGDNLGSSNPIMIFTATGPTPSMYSQYYAQKTLTTGNIISQTSYYSDNASSVKTEFANYQVSVRNNTGTNIDGAMTFNCIKDNVLTTMLEINGDESQINAFQPLDMNNNSIVSSTGGITLDTTSSSGTGVITLNTKAGTAGTGTGLVLTGNTLTATSAGGSSGHHLCLYLPNPTTGVSTLYKIALLNP